MTSEIGKMQPGNPVGIIEMLGLHDDREGALPAVCSGSKSLSREDLHQLSDQYAVSLLDMGLKPGDRVASLLPNCVEYFIHFIGCLKAGLVVLPIDFRSQIDEIDEALETYHPVLLLAQADRYCDVEACANRHVLTKGVLELSAPINARFRFEDVVSGRGDPTALPERTPADQACILLSKTGGSVSCGIVHSHGCIGAMADMSRDTMAFSDGERFLIGTQLSNLAAIQSCFAALAARSTIILPASGSVQDLAPTIRAFDPTVLQVSPNALFNLTLDERLSSKSLGDARLFVSGSSLLHREVIEAVTRLLDAEVHETYGFAETGQVAMIRHDRFENDAGKSDRSRHAAGRSGPSRSRRPAKKPDGRVSGRLQFRPPAQMAGIWHNPAMETRRKGGDWPQPADGAPPIGQPAADGDDIRTHGQPVDRFINSKDEVESALCAYPGVESAGVISLPDPFHGHEIVAYIVPSDWNFPPPTSEVIQYVRNRVGRVAPDTVQFVGTLPFTENGIIDTTLLSRTGKDAVRKLAGIIGSDRKLN